MRVSFPGGCASGVTGSCILIETTSKKILLDCGLYQGGTILNQYKENKTFFKRNKIKPNSLDYIFIEHAHADHSQLVELAVKEGFQGTIIMPIGNLELFKIMGIDSCNIMARDAEDLSKKYEKEFLPIYESADVLRACSLTKEFAIGEKYAIDDGLSFRFFATGHIINSAGIEIWIKAENRTQHIVYTSDLGNQKIPQFFVEPLDIPQNANLLIGECTYSRPNRNATEKDRKKDLEKIAQIINETCVQKDGKVLIPVFTLHRAQTILSLLYILFYQQENFDIPIVLASPLGVKMCEIFDKQLATVQDFFFTEVLLWDNIHLVSNFEDMAKWCDGNKPCVLLTASGMMTAGYSRYAAAKILPRIENYILFVGYSVENSLASKIKDHKTKTVSIDGKVVACRSGIADLKSFSSHASYDDLIDIYSSNNYDKIALVHGNFEDKKIFAEELQKKMAFRNRTGRVIVVNKGTILSL